VRLVVFAARHRISRGVDSCLGVRTYPEGIKRTEDVDLSKLVRRKTGRKLDFFIIAVVLLVIGILLFQRLHPNVSPAVSSSLEKSIAVLPFENFSEDKAFAFFADGVQDEILTDLAKKNR